MSIRANHHDHFEDVLEMVDCRMKNQFSRLVVRARGTVGEQA